jgi:signal transduction histidine kinase
MKFFWLLLVVLYARAGVVAQPIQGAENAAIGAIREQIRLARPDSSRANLYLKLADEFITQQQFPQARLSLQKAAALASKTQDPVFRWKIPWNYACYYQRLGQWDSCIVQAQQALDQLTPTNDWRRRADVMYLLATAYADKTDYPNALMVLDRLRTFANQHHLNGSIRSSLALRTSILLSIGSEKESLRSINEFIQWSLNAHDSKGLMLALNDKAAYYDKHRLYGRALPYWQKALSLATTKGTDPVYSIEIRTYLAHDLILLHQFNKANGQLQIALQDAKKYQEFISSIFVYTELANLQASQGQLMLAQESAQTAIRLAKQYNRTELLTKALTALLLIQKKRNEYRAALQTSEAIAALRDSLIGIEKYKTVMALETRFAVTKKEQNLILLKKDAAIRQLEAVELQQQQVLYLSLSIFLSVLLLMALGVNLNAQNTQRLLTAKNIEISRQRDAISQQSAQFEELNTLKTKLLAILGHDLRSPIVSLRATLELMTNQMLSAEQTARQMGRLRTQVDSVYSHLDNLLHWATLQNNGLKTRPTQINLLLMVQDAVELYDYAIQQKQISVTILSEQEITAWADINQIIIVVRNILHNAIKFSPVGGTIRVESRQLTGKSLLTIQDSGMGISPQVVTNLSTGLINSKPGTAGETGTGLGLLICHQLIELNSGRLRFESDPGQGTAVTIELLSS